MAYSITTNILPTGVSYYVKADSDNPSVIEEGGQVTLKFSADGTYYTLQKAASSVVVTGATVVSWTCVKPFTSGTLILNNPTGTVTVSVTAKAGVTPQSIASPFKYTGKAPLDVRTMLSKEQMLAIIDTQQPEMYFAICTDDNNLYIYNKSFTAGAETGKFKPYEEVIDLPGAITAAMSTTAGKEAMEGAIASTLPGAITGVMEDPESAQALCEAMFDSEHFQTTVDNKIDIAISLIQAIESN